MFLAYLFFVILPKVIGIVFIVLIVALAALMAITFALCVNEGEAHIKEKEACKGAQKKAVVIVALAALFIVILPTEKQSYMLAGAYFATEIAQNEDVQKLPDNVLGAVNSWLEEMQPKGDAND